MALYGSANNPIIEVLIDGVWTDISSRTRGEQKVVIIRGRASEQSRATAQRANLTFENTDGYFSNRLPTSVNYRKLGKNTQLRVRAGTGDNYAHFPYNDQQDVAYATTADKAVLDITSDIDIRMEIWPHSWRPTGDMTLAAKYLVTGDQRSWMLVLGDDGTLALLWSSTGTLATRLDSTSTASIPASSGQLAVRATLDVNNGAAGNTVTFYTAPSLSGSWTILGSAVIKAGTTSIFSSTTAVTVGGGVDTRGGIGDNTGFGGKLYGFELYNGIAGTKVADFDATGRSLGDTSWSDGLGTPNTWTLAGSNVRLTSDRVRFWGELASIRTDWDKAGVDVTVPAAAYGPLRRLSQGAKPLAGAMYRNFVQYGPYAWWPMEDGQDSTAAANAADGSMAVARPAQVTAVTFGSTDCPPGATSAIAFTGATSQFLGRMELLQLPSPAVYSIVFYVRMTSLPATTKVFCSIGMFGQLARVDIGISSSQWNIEFFDITGASITSAAASITSIDPRDGWVGYNLLLEESGASDIAYSQRWDAVQAGFGGGTGPTVIASYDAVPPNSIRFMAANDALFNDMRISHAFVSSQELDLTNDTFRDASNAYLGETAADRIQRLSDEEGVAVEITGLYAPTEAMGYQTPKTYVDLISECWDVDGGIGGETRDSLAMAYRTRVDMENREDVTLNYDSSDLADTPKSVDDDLGLLNDVTVRRSDGSSARSVIEEGYNSISDPPNGVGRYDTDMTLNVAEDEQLASIAGWIALVGSWDQDRYPSVAVALHRSRLLADSTLFARVVAAALGDTMLLVDLPAWMPPDDVPELIQGYTETLSKFLWEINFNGTPAGPYRSVPVLGSDVYVPRLDATGHTTGGSLTTTATAISLVTPAGSARWADSATYPSDFPMDLVLEGEVVSLTAVTGTSSPQAGTITRSVNGVIKAHNSGISTRLARPFYLGR